MSLSAILRTKDGIVQYVAFWGHDFPNGQLSQWYPSPFTFTISDVDSTLLKSIGDILKKRNIVINFGLISGKLFLTAEHFMMAGKAMLFDTSCIGNIMAATNPKTVKNAGRKVKNFNQSVWDSVNILWVAIGNYLKFTQHVHLKTFLKNTGDRILIEASPFDTIWGVGLPPNSELLRTPSSWKGENRLGDALMIVRSLI
jgi:ribA/ribD-fused uncharacterized protein